MWAWGDGGGGRWERVNLGEHHNALASDPALHYSDTFCGAEESCDPLQSTSYTSMAAVGPNEALICYDRLGNGWAGAPGPWGEQDVVFCMRVRAVQR